MNFDDFLDMFLMTTWHDHTPQARCELARINFIFNFGTHMFLGSTLGM
jgi:hypothetical protein